MARPTKVVKTNRHDHERHKKAKWYEVTCEIHGKPEEGTGRKWLKVPIPLTRAERMAGCPLCAIEARAYEKELSLRG